MTVNYVEMTVEEFKSEFPRACSHEKAIKYFVAYNHKPYAAKCSEIECPATFKIEIVGYTNHSRKKTTTRFAMIPVE